jgi:hypothetical protein
MVRSDAAGHDEGPASRQGRGEKALSMAVVVRAAQGQSVVVQPTFLFVLSLYKSSPRGGPQQSGRADSPDAGYDDTADHSEPGDNDGRCNNRSDGNLHNLNNTAAITAELATRIERNRQAALGRASRQAQGRVKQESSGVVTGAAAGRRPARQMAWRLRRNTRPQRGSQTSTSEAPDEADFPDAAGTTTRPTT